MVVIATSPPSFLIGTSVQDRLMTLSRVFPEGMVGALMVAMLVKDKGLARDKENVSGCEIRRGSRKILVTEDGL